MAHHDTDHRRSDLDERCARHQFEPAVDRCRQCGHAFCGECLVYSFGEKQPPFCIPCALSAAGVRSNAARPPAVPKKELRRRQKAEARRAEEAERKAAEAPRIDWTLPVNGTDPDQDSAFPRFDDDEDAEDQRPPRSSPPPAGKPASRGGLFGRRKKKVIPF